MSTASERLLRCANWTYGTMLRAYPPTFQREFAREMMLVFTNQAKDTIKNSGHRGFLRFAVHIVWDWITTLLDETEGETMRKALTAGVATFLLLAVDWLTFHDLREPHTVRDYLTLFASLLVFFYLGMELVERQRMRQHD